MRIIALAGISGCMFVSQLDAVVVGTMVSGAPVYMNRKRWYVFYSDGKKSYAHWTKTSCAETFLKWWFGMHDMWPRYR